MGDCYHDFLALVFSLAGNSGISFKQAGLEVDEFINCLSLADFIRIVEEIGAIPEQIDASSSEEKLYSKSSDIVLARACSHKWNQ